MHPLLHLDLHARALVGVGVVLAFWLALWLAGDYAAWRRAHSRRGGR